MSQGKGEDTKGEAQCRVSLSGLLNALDGIGAQDGRILFATTNHYSVLDPALIRPGRMDLHVEFKLASKEQAKELFYRFYAPSKDSDDETEMQDVGDREPDFGESSMLITSPPSPMSPQVDAVRDKRIVGSVVPMPKEGPPLRALQNAFADAIPARRLTMAAIQ